MASARPEGEAASKALHNPAATSIGKEPASAAIGSHTRSVRSAASKMKNPPPKLSLLVVHQTQQATCGPTAPTGVQTSACLCFHFCEQNRRVTLRLPSPPSRGNELPCSSAPASSGDPHLSSTPTKQGWEGCVDENNPSPHCVR